MLQTLSGLFLVAAVKRPRKRKRTNRENPRRVPAQIGKIPKKWESPKKDDKGQKRKDKSRLETPPVSNPPPLAALKVRLLGRTKILRSRAKETQHTPIP